MTDPLEEIHKLRKLRQHSALSRLLQTKKDLRDAVLEEEKSSREVLDFSRYRPKQEERLFQKLALKPININDLDHFKLCVEELYAKQKKLTEQLKQAKQMVEQAEKKFKESRHAYRQATRQLQKMEEHQNIRQQQKFLQNERRVENEQNEYSQTIKT